MPTSTGPDPLILVVATAAWWLATAVGIALIGLREARIADRDADPGAGRRAAISRFWAGLTAVIGLWQAISRSATFADGEYGRVVEPWVGDLALLALSAILVERAFRRDATSFIYAAALGLLIALTDFNLTYLSDSTEAALLIEGLILLAVGFAADRLRRRIGRDGARPVDAPSDETAPDRGRTGCIGAGLAARAGEVRRALEVRVGEPLRPRPPDAQPAGRVGLRLLDVEVVLRPERPGQRSRRPSRATDRGQVAPPDGVTGEQVPAGGRPAASRGSIGGSRLRLGARSVLLTWSCGVYLSRAASRRGHCAPRPRAARLAILTTRCCESGGLRSRFRHLHGDRIGPAAVGQSGGLDCPGGGAAEEEGRVGRPDHRGDARRVRPADLPIDAAGQRAGGQGRPLGAGRGVGRRDDAGRAARRPVGSRRAAARR